MRPWLSVQGAADATGLDYETILECIHAGRLRASRPTGPKGHFRIKPEDLDHFFEQGIFHAPGAGSCSSGKSVPMRSRQRNVSGSFRQRNVVHSKETA